MDLPAAAATHWRARRRGLFVPGTSLLFIRSATTTSARSRVTSRNGDLRRGEKLPGTQLTKLLWVNAVLPLVKPFFGAM